MKVENFVLKNSYEKDSHKIGEKTQQHVWEDHLGTEGTQCIEELF